MSWENRDYHRDDTGGIPPVQFRFPPFTKLTLVLIVVNLALFLLKVSESTYASTVQYGGLTFNPQIAPWWQLWRWVTYQYLHVSGLHVFFNMLALYFFLPTLERRWGWPKAFAFYTLSGIAAAFTFLLFVLVTGEHVVWLIGASGSVFGILGAVALLYPEQQLILLVFPLPIRLAAGLFAALFLLMVIGDRDFSSAAHLGGLAFGFFAPLVSGPWLAKQQHKFERWQGQRGAQAEQNEQDAVDQILAKVARSGMQSLTSREKKTLQRASDNQRKRDQERARQYGRI